MSDTDALYSAAHDQRSDIAKLYAAMPMQNSIARANPTYDAGVHSYTLPFPNAPHDGGAQDIANRNAIVGQQHQANNVQYAINTAPTWLDKLAMMTNVGLLTAGAGSVLAPLASAAVGGGTAGTIAGGAAVGAAGGAASSALSGGNVAKKIGTGALLGGVGGAIASQTGGLKNYLTGAGVNPSIASGLIKTGTSAITGGLRGAITGQGVGAGAAAGALSAGTNAVAGSILTGAGTIFQGSPQNNPIISSEQTYNAPPPQFDAYNSGDSMSYNFETDPDNLFGNVQAQPMDTGYGNYSPQGDPNSGAFNGAAGLPGSGADPYLAQLMGGIDPTTGANFSVPGGGSGNGSPAASAGGSLLGKLAALLGGGSGSNGSASTLAQLLGLGAQAGSTVLNSNAAKSAANTFAGQTKFNPYGVTTNNGSTSFDGTNALSKLSPGAQATANGLTGMNNADIAALTAGPGADRTANFNALTSSQLQAQQRLMANTQDNEFANGILGSTAGGYQTQGALGAIGQQISGDQVTANDLANQTQQQRLAQLTAGLNGNQQINQQQLDQIRAGAGIGTSASYANNQAYRPQLSTNANSNIGNILGQLAPQPIGAQP